MQVPGVHNKKLTPAEMYGVPTRTVAKPGSPNTLFARDMRCSRLVDCRSMCALGEKIEP
jgi:hypothetical protein